MVSIPLIFQGSYPCRTGWKAFREAVGNAFAFPNRGFVAVMDGRGANKLKILYIQHIIVRTTIKAWMIPEFRPLGPDRNETGSGLEIVQSLTLH